MKSLNKTHFISENHIYSLQYKQLEKYCSKSLPSETKSSTVDAMSKRLFWCLIALTLSFTPLFGTARMFTSIQSGTSWYGGFARYHDSIPFRSSYTIDVDAAMGVRDDRWEISTIVPFRYTSASPVFDNLSRREFYSLGLGVDFRMLATNKFGWFGSGFVSYNWYLVDQAFLSFGAKTGPFWELVSRNLWRVSVAIPLGFDFRKDIIGVSVGIVLRLSYDQNEAEVRNLSYGY